MDNNKKGDKHVLTPLYKIICIALYVLKLIPGCKPLLVVSRVLHLIGNNNCQVFNR